jgi:uncharacterized protein YndB with AHSA1/START domain
MASGRLIRFPTPPNYWLSLWKRSLEGNLDRLESYVIALKTNGETKMTRVTYLAPKDQPIIEQAAPRLFKAPRSLVWKCFSQREHVARWWGVRGRTTIETFEFKVGGIWRFAGSYEGGHSMTFKGVYREIVPIEKIVNTFGVEGMFDGQELEETHSFIEQGNETLYSSISRFDTFEARDGMIESGMEEGANESMAQLDELLAELLQNA